MNKFLKEDNLGKQNIEKSFYFHVKNTNIFLFSHPIFKSLFMSKNGNIHDDKVNYFNKSFLQDALLVFHL